MDEKIDPNVTGVYRCETAVILDAVDEMMSTGTVDWSGRLSGEQVVCLQWVFTQIQSDLDASDNPETMWMTADDIFGEMIKTPGTFVVTVNAEAQDVHIDFEPATEGE
jgi:hypothetical protein